MALLLLIAIGLTAGWLASIITRTEAAGEILRQLGVGLIGSLVAGLLINQGTILGGLTLLALGTSIAVAAALLVLYHAVLSQRAKA